MELARMRLLGERLLVKRRRRGGMWSGSIVLPDTVASKARPQQGMVLLSAASGISPGENVVFGYGCGEKLDDEHVILHRGDVITKVEYGTA
jgi:co-chaperonin GroES (HSP10)